MSRRHDGSEMWGKTNDNRVRYCTTILAAGQRQFPPIIELIESAKPITV